MKSARYAVVYLKYMGPWELPKLLPPIQIGTAEAIRTQEDLCKQFEHAKAQVTTASIIGVFITLDQCGVVVPVKKAYRYYLPDTPVAFCDVNEDDKDVSFGDLVSDPALYWTLNYDIPSGATNPLPKLAPEIRESLLVAVKEVMNKLAAEKPNSFVVNIRSKYANEVEITVSEAQECVPKQN